MHLISSKSNFYIFVKRVEEDKLEESISDSFSPAAQIYNTTNNISVTNNNLRNFIINRVREIAYSSKVGNSILKRCGNLDKKSLTPIAENVFMHAINKGYLVKSFTHKNSTSTWLTSYVEDTVLYEKFNSNLDNLIIEVVSMYANSSV